MSRVGAPPDGEVCAHCGARPFSICAPLDPSELARLGRLSATIEVPEGQSFMAEGEPTPYCFNIVDGAARLVMLLPDGRRQVIGFLFQGDFLGTAMSGTSTMSAEALTPVRLCRFERRAFQDALAKLPALERSLLERTRGELETARGQMLLLGRKAARERVASFLLDISRRAERIGCPASPVHLPMTRTDIADYLGLTTETVSRVLTQLKSARLIRIEGINRVHLLDPAGLELLRDGI